MPREKKYTPEFIKKIGDYYNNHTTSECKQNIDLFWNGKPISDIRNFIARYKNQMILVSPEKRIENIVIRLYDEIAYCRKYTCGNWIKEVNNKYHIGNGWLTIYKRLKTKKIRDVDIRNENLVHLKKTLNPSSAKCCKVLQCEVARESFIGYLDEFETTYPNIQIDYDIIRTLIVILEKRIYKKGLPSCTPKKVCTLALIYYAVTILPKHSCRDDHRFQLTKAKIFRVFATDYMTINKSMKELFPNQSNFHDFITFIRYRIEHSHSILSQPIDFDQ